MKHLEALLPAKIYNFDLIGPFEAFLNYLEAFWALFGLESIILRNLETKLV